jgi:hypothetical protein
MKEIVLDIELVDRPIPGENKRQDDTGRRGLHNGDESLIIIDTGMLREPTKNPPGLVPLECPIGLKLVLKIHLPVTTLAPWGHESSVLFLHCRPLMWISEGGLN